MLAVCLLTCGPERVAETARTASTFKAHNRGRKDVVLLHVDGGGEGSRVNQTIAAGHGFETISAPRKRVGQIESLRAFLADRRVTTSNFVLWLENDWESERPLPPPEFFKANGHFAQVRLYGARKMKGDGPRALAGTHIIGTKTPIDWRPLEREPGWEKGRCHWGAGGTLVKPSILLGGAYEAARLKDIIVAANNCVTIRPVENILWHIGEKTTEGFFG